MISEQEIQTIMSHIKELEYKYDQTDMKKNVLKFVDFMNSAKKHGTPFYVLNISTNKEMFSKLRERCKKDNINTEKLIYFFEEFSSNITTMHHIIFYKSKFPEYSDEDRTEMFESLNFQEPDIENIEYEEVSILSKYKTGENIIRYFFTFSPIYELTVYAAKYKDEIDNQEYMRILPNLHKVEMKDITKYFNFASITSNGSGVFEKLFDYVKKVSKKYEEENVKQNPDFNPKYDFPDSETNKRTTDKNYETGKQSDRFDISGNFLLKW